MRRWNPERELAALLDALDREVLSAADAELAELLHRAGAEEREAIRAMRRGLAAAEAGLHLGSPWPAASQGARPVAKPQ